MAKKRKIRSQPEKKVGCPDRWLSRVFILLQSVVMTNKSDYI